MAYLFKHTPLQTRFHVNMTCLVPTDNPEVAAPKKVDLRTALRPSSTSGFDVVTRRLELRTASSSKSGSTSSAASSSSSTRSTRPSSSSAPRRTRPTLAQRLRHRFGIDELQADAVLEIKLYRLARMEIDAIRAELAEKEARAAELRAAPGDDEGGRWNDDPQGAARAQEAVRRRPPHARSPGPTPCSSTRPRTTSSTRTSTCIVTRDGWVKRQRSYTDARRDPRPRGRRGGVRARWLDARDHRLLHERGPRYTVRVDDLPQTTGYGDPSPEVLRLRRQGARRRRRLARRARAARAASRDRRPSRARPVPGRRRAAGGRRRRAVRRRRSRTTGWRCGWTLGASRSRPTRTAACSCASARASASSARTWRAATRTCASPRQAGPRADLPRPAGPRLQERREGRDRDAARRRRTTASSAWPSRDAAREGWRSRRAGAARDRPHDEVRGHEPWQQGPDDHRARHAPRRHPAARRVASERRPLSEHHHVTLEKLQRTIRSLGDTVGQRSRTCSLRSAQRLSFRSSRACRGISAELAEGSLSRGVPPHEILRRCSAPLRMTAEKSL